LLKIYPLKNQFQFKAALATGDKWVTKAFVVIVHRPSSVDQDLHYGVIASRKVGSAVNRNRAKRRLREVIREIIPQEGCAGCHYILIARAGVLTSSFEDIKKDLRWALTKLHLLKETID
jgi:ribonuclease P protein component